MQVSCSVKWIRNNLIEQLIQLRHVDEIMKSEVNQCGNAEFVAVVKMYSMWKVYFLSELHLMSRFKFLMYFFTLTIDSSIFFNLKNNRKFEHDGIVVVPVSVYNFVDTDWKPACCFGIKGNISEVQNATLLHTWLEHLWRFTFKNHNYGFKDWILILC